MQSSLQDPATSPAGAADAFLLPNARLDAGRRLAIYQRGYYARLVECMGAQFKVLKRALGAELFDDFARLYLKENPPANYTLTRLGAGFADYLERTRPDAEAEEPEEWVDFMIELARFEWRVYEIFDRQTADGSAHCVDLSQYRFPVSGYYRLMTSQPDTEPDFPPPVATYVILVRNVDYRVGIHTVSRERYESLQAGAGF